MPEAVRSNGKTFLVRLPQFKFNNLFFEQIIIDLFFDQIIEFKLKEPGPQGRIYYTPTTGLFS